MRLLLDAVLTSAIINCVQCIICAALAWSFRIFSNLPAGRLQHGRTDLHTIILGGLCKQGPWLFRLLHLLQACLLVIFAIFLFDEICLGDLPKTYNCAAYKADCAQNKLVNCLYHYENCLIDSKQALQCFNSEFREGFSGRLDVRLLHSNYCVRCEILKGDAEDIANDDEFYILDEGDRGTDFWKCSDTAISCFYTRVWATIVCNCQSTALNILEPNLYKEMSESCENRRLASSTNTSNFALASPRRRSQVVEPDPVYEQSCAFAPDEPTYYYSAERCQQQGSYLYSNSLLYCYLSGSSWIVFACIGQVVRVTSRPEPWFFNPRQPGESIMWKVLRLMGP